MNEYLWICKKSVLFSSVQATSPPIKIQPPYCKLLRNRMDSMRSPGFSQVCPAGSTRDPSRGQKIGCHIENLHATNFFLGRMMGKVHVVPITLMSCDGLLVCVCFWVYIYKVMFWANDFLKDMFWW